MVLSKGFKPQRGTDYPFPLTVIAFNDVIPVLICRWLTSDGHRSSRFSNATHSYKWGLIRVDEAGELPAFHVI
ncbi:hypothetical protein SERPA_00016 (plasmid) [Serratia marcescens]